MKSDSLQDGEGQSLVVIESTKEKGLSLEHEYCRALAEVLHYSPPPVTVGLYAQWGHGKKELLEIIKGHLHFKARETGGNKQRANCLQRLWTWLCLVGRIIFFQPVQKEKQCQHTQYIFIDFSAWEYIGCDHTWAGMITTLCDTIESKYRLPLSIFRVFGREVQNITGDRNKWLWKRWCKVLLFVGLPALVITTVALVMLFREYVTYGVIASILAGTCPPVLSFLRVLGKIVFSLKRSLERKMNRTNMSDQLGFMHCVKTEVEVLTNFLQFKSFSQQRDIRVVLLINDLDICTSDRVVGVLDAVNILLSDKEVPFISILAVDPQIMVECIEKSSNMFNNGYEYLDRIISLPFSVPRMNTRTKLQILREYVHGKDEKEKQHDAEMKSNVAENLSCCPSYRRGPNHIGENPENAGDGENHVADLKIKVFNNLKTIHDGETSLPGNKIQLMRILNTITIELLVREKADKNMQQKQQNDAVRDWVLLTISWPCRLSWVLQCVEDKIQSIELKLEEGNMKETKEMGEAKQERLEYLEQSLLQVFRDNEGVLDTIKKRIKNLLELDGDPDVFKAFLLKCDFKVKDIEALANIVSLDHSLKRKLELIRGLRKKGSLDCTISIPNEDGNASL